MKNNLIFFLLLMVSHQVLSFENDLSDKNETNIDKIFLNIDQQRRSNPQLLAKSLKEYKSKYTSLNAKQQLYYDYLFAYKLSFQGDYAAAELALTKILGSQVKSKLIKFRARYTLVNIYAYMRNWSAGLKQLAYILKQYPNINDLEHQQNGLLTTIIFYNQIGQYKLAIDYSELLAKTTLTSSNQCLLNQLNLRAKFELGKLMVGDKQFESSVLLCDEVIAKNFIRSYKARLLIDENKYQEAINVLLPHFNEVINTHYKILIVELSNIIATAYFEISNYEKAKEFIDISCSHLDDVKNTEQALNTYHLLFKLNEQKNNLAQALKFYIKYSDTNNIYKDEEKSKHLAFQLAQHNNFQQQSQIKLLDEQNKLLNIEQQINKSELANNRLFMSLLSIIVVLLAFFGFRSNQTQKQLKALSEFDPLTGVYNRGHFTHLAKTALAYAKNTKQDLCVVMFDLDYFKSINDSYGHACGDWALKEVVTAIQMVIRQEDIFARIGGEEFCLILPNCDLPSSIMVVEQYRRVLTEIDSIASGQQFSISASFGITDVENSGYQLEQLLADADTAMYKSKENGRNQVTLFNTF